VKKELIEHSVILQEKCAFDAHIGPLIERLKRDIKVLRSYVVEVQQDNALWSIKHNAAELFPEGASKKDT